MQYLGLLHVYGVMGRARDENGQIQGQSLARPIHILELKNKLFFLI